MERQSEQVFGSTLERSRRGRARMAQIAAETEVERQAMIAGMVADWPTKPTVAEMALIKEFASHSVRASRMRNCGRHQAALDASRQMTRVGRLLGIQGPSNEDRRSARVRARYGVRDNAEPAQRTLREMAEAGFK